MKSKLMWKRLCAVLFPFAVAAVGYLMCTYGSAQQFAAGCFMWGFVYAGAVWFDQTKIGPEMISLTRQASSVFIKIGLVVLSLVFVTLLVPLAFLRFPMRLAESEHEKQQRTSKPATA